MVIVDSSRYRFTRKSGNGGCNYCRNGTGPELQNNLFGLRSKKSTQRGLHTKEKRKINGYRVELIEAETKYLIYKN